MFCGFHDLDTVGKLLVRFLRSQHSGMWIFFVFVEDLNFEFHRCFAVAGVLGIQVKIMLQHDPAGKTGPKRPLPDNVTVMEPKEEESQPVPSSEQKENLGPALPAGPAQVVA